jgi:hypothetical protein
MPLGLRRAPAKGPFPRPYLCQREKPAPCDAAAAGQWLVVTNEAGDQTGVHACNTHGFDDDRAGRVHQLGCNAPDENGCNCVWPTREEP